MKIDAGQRNGLRELESIAEGGDALEIISVVEPTEESGFLRVEIAVSFRDVRRRADGVPLRQRERFCILIPPLFPFRQLHVFVMHDRWAGRPHVQWSRSLCLYQAPGTEWNPSDGMFGFIDRLYTWVEQAAVDQLDPTGAPLHPPVAYVRSSSVPLVVPRADTPRIEDEPWVGFACIRDESDHRIDITDWCESDEASPAGPVAAALLLPKPISFEFPGKVRELLDALETRGVSRREVIKALGLAATINGWDTRLLVLIGTPTRGNRDSGAYQQHLVAWLLVPVVANGLRLALAQFSTHDELREIGRECERLVLEWSDGAEVEWCRLSEARPEVTIRRDEDSPLGWFRGKSAGVWGCGAIGGQVAEALARAGATKLVLRDNGVVTPGVLVRQPFDNSDIGKNKAVATQERLLRIFPDLFVEAREEDILSIPLDRVEWTDGADIVIDATASLPVAQHLEARQEIGSPNGAAIASMVLGRNVQRALLHVAKRGYSGATADLARKTKIEALGDSRFTHFADEFWPFESPTLFQPEPGCSEPTFVGSHAEVMGLVGIMLCMLAKEMTSGDLISASSHLLTAPGVRIEDQELREHDTHFDPDICMRENVDGYSVRIAPQAFADLQAWVWRSERANGPLVETGGHLFGERNDAARVIWVSRISGPPPDSEASTTGFVCGTDGVAQESEAKSRSSGGSVKFVGMWHTHPCGAPLPSETDCNSMRDTVDDVELSCPRSLLLVIGTARLKDSFRATASLFSRGRVPSRDELIRQAKPATITMAAESKP